MKVSQIKNSYKTFIRKLIAEHDDDAYTVSEVIRLCKKNGFDDLSDTRVRSVLGKYAEKIKHENRVYWGNPKAIAQIEGDK